MYLIFAAIAAVAIALAWAYSFAARLAFRGDALRVLRAALKSPSLFFHERAAAFVKPTEADYAIIVRALSTDRIMLLSFEKREGGADVKALGIDGTLYELALAEIPSCSCPAFKFKRTSQCKHLAWLKTKVMGIPPNHYLASQSAYTRVELDYVLQLDPQAPRALAPIRKALGLMQDDARIDDCTCAICFCDLEDGEAVVKCAAGCEKKFHHECNENNIAVLARDGKPPSCPCCRAYFIDELALQTLKERDGRAYVQITHPLGPRRRSSSSTGSSGSRRRS